MENGAVQSVGDAEIDEKIQQWLKWDKNEKTRDEMCELVRGGDIAELRSRLLGRLSFGTAGTAAADAGSLSGMRGRMESGFSRFNDVMIIETTQGLAAYIKNQFDQSELSVAVGYDARHNSERFSKLAANVLALNGIKVYLFRELVPTPFVPYTVIKRNCCAGIMITASHNPKDDNGYKVYWKCGAQILAPHDSGICEEILKSLEPMEGVWDLSHLDHSPLVLDPRKDPCDIVTDEYMVDVLKFSYLREVNEKSDLKFTYTPLHGVGLNFTPQTICAYGFKPENIVLVPEQANFDPDFTTCPSHPNPEEGVSVLKWAMDAADKNQSPIIFANDPDADRFQLSEKQGNNTWHVFSGNEMGALLSWWIWARWKGANPDKDASKVYLINSAVSSKIVATMAEHEGFKNEETLTGFKHMGNRAIQLEKEGNTVLLCWEESIGFMAGLSPEKDGLLAAAIFAEYAAHLYSNGKSFMDQLFEIYKRFGFHLTHSSYFICNAQQTKQVFESVRNQGAQGKYPDYIGSQRIKYIRDLTTGYDNSQPDNKAILPVSKSSQMLTFTLENGSVVTLRGSGTEPKLKYYMELKTEPGKDSSEISAVRKQLLEFEKTFIEESVKPEKYGLKPRD